MTHDELEDLIHGCLLLRLYHNLQVFCLFFTYCRTTTVQLKHARTTLQEKDKREEKGAGGDTTWSLNTVKLLRRGLRRLGLPDGAL